MRTSLIFAGSIVLHGLLGCSGCAGSSQGPAPPSPSVSTADGGADPKTGAIRYMALGDSISQGIGTDDFEARAFPTRLSDRWKQKGCQVELSNLGIAGYKASDVLTQEVPQIKAFAPTFITLQAGANDIANGVTVEEYRKNIRAVLDAAKASGARVVVLPQNEWFRSPEGPNYGTDLSSKRDTFDAALIEETKAKGAELVDLRNLYRTHADNKMWAADGLHPNVDAYDQMAGELARVIPAPCGK